LKPTVARDDMAFGISKDWIGEMPACPLKKLPKKSSPDIRPLFDYRRFIRQIRHSEHPDEAV
jgi:hypothetical protein